ncbi:MAG: cyclase family protein [Lishizhenia sp.]
MIFSDEHGRKVNLSSPLDISIPLSNDENNPRAWYVNPPVIEPVRENGWIGSVEEGGSVNFRNIFFNPHGHGTHTECLGHITKEVFSINERLKNFFFNCELITVTPKEVKNGTETDYIISKETIQNAIKGNKTEALVIRTLPNESLKKSKNYSASNPPYFDAECVPLLLSLGIKHLLIDLPSVDRESDGGVLAFHHAFWEVPNNPNHERTITEMVFVPNTILDGDYLLNLQVAPFENDAAPSRPVLYKIL